ncbi:MAG: hypothetical protein IPG92_10935 [Flavobacteriales bacterium]|nr:hypothetical protein [Flavobacteriales bacterium]
MFVVGTGQSALIDMPRCRKRWVASRIKVHLKDNDVEKVVRTVVLQKKTDKKADRSQVERAFRGNLTRQLKTTKIATRPEDKDAYVVDYPLLPVRQRFWEKVLHSIDPWHLIANAYRNSGVVHEACKRWRMSPWARVIPG